MSSKRTRASSDAMAANPGPKEVRIAADAVIRVPQPKPVGAILRTLGQTCDKLEIPRAVVHELIAFLRLRQDYDDLPVSPGTMHDALWHEILLNTHLAQPFRAYLGFDPEHSTAKPRFAPSLHYYVDNISPYGSGSADVEKGLRRVRAMTYLGFLRGYNVDPRLWTQRGTEMENIVRVECEKCAAPLFHLLSVPHSVSEAITNDILAELGYGEIKFVYGNDDWRAEGVEFTVHVVTLTGKTEKVVLDAFSMSEDLVPEGIPVCEARLCCNGRQLPERAPVARLLKDGDTVHLVLRLAGC